MGLTEQLLRWGAQRPHLLIVEAPGGTAARIAVERLARERGWPLADSPADCDVLVACGTMSGELAEALEVTWNAVPGPRVRVQLDGGQRVADPDVVAAQLDVAVGRLADVHAQRQDAQSRGRADDMDHDMDMGDHEDMDTAGDTGGGMDRDMDMGGGMDHDMDMSMPGGLEMADRAPDRDGLKLDVLHLRLGPFLPSWPAGLVLDVSMQGDVLQDARASTLHVHGAHSFFQGQGALHHAAAYLDSASRLLQLTGWLAAATTARELRDRVLADALFGSSEISTFATRVRRSRALRWSLRDLGVLTTHRAAELGIGGPAQRADGDVRDRLLQWLIEADEPMLVQTEAGPSDSEAIVRALPELVTGLDLAGARLVVASLDPDLARSEVGARSG